MVLWLAIWDLVDSEPFISSTEKTWEMTLDVFDVIDLWSEWVIDVDDDDLCS